MKRLAVAAAAAAAGAVVLAIVVPRLDPTAMLRSDVNREKAVARARELSRRYGVDASLWRSAVWVQGSEKQRTYRAAHPDDPVGKLFDPLSYTIVLWSADRRQVTVVLYPDLRPAEWRKDGGAPPENKQTSPPIGEILADFAGERLSSFGPPTTSDHQGVVDTKREWSAQQPALLTARIETEEKNGLLQSVTLSPVYGEKFNREYDQSSRNPTPVKVALWVRGLLWIPALVLCFWFMARRRFQYRIPAMLLTAQVVWAAVSFWGSTYYSQIWDMRSGAGQINISPGVANYAWSPWAGFAFATLFLFAGAGRVMRVAGNGEKWFTLDLLARGRMRNRAVGESLAVGLLSGVALAALGYLAALVFRGTLPFHSLDALVAPVPLVVAVRLSAMVLPLALFGFLFPWTGYLKKPVLRWLVFLPAAVLVSATSPPGTIPAFGTALLMVAGYLLIYLKADLLSAMAAALSARFVVVPCVLFAQRSGSLRQTGLFLLGLGVVVLAACVHTALRAPERDARSEGIATDIPLGPEESDRERLAAEFEVARKAQQAALPDAPPAISGYSLAATCEPAKQVGGDLYDFFELPDGRLGITVADVSGKGVPAALYMMVTKGLLTAVSRDSADLPHILQQVNLQLYRACRRKVFVTMAAVALDLPRRRLEYGRAGHNPVVWRRASRGETLLLKPRGLGLGMTPSEPFKRNLEIEEIELEPGDAVVLYSDGVTEAVNGAMDQYGEYRLVQGLERTDGKPAAETRDAIVRDLTAFMGATPARDDITIVVLRVEPVPA